VRKHVVADPAAGQDGSLDGIYTSQMTSLRIGPSLDAMVRAASL
jgi:hypothetical protein